MVLRTRDPNEVTSLRAFRIESIAKRAKQPPDDLRKRRITEIELLFQRLRGREHIIYIDLKLTEAIAKAAFSDPPVRIPGNPNSGQIKKLKLGHLTYFDPQQVVGLLKSMQDSALIDLMDRVSRITGTRYGSAEEFRRKALGSILIVDVLIGGMSISAIDLAKNRFIIPAEDLLREYNAPFLEQLQKLGR